MDEEERILSQIPKAKMLGPRAKSISSVINRVLQEKGYAFQQSSAILEEAWKAAVGSSLAYQSRIGKIQRGVLNIYACNAIARSELEFERTRLLKSLQQQLPEFKIRDIKIRLAEKR